MDTINQGDVGNLGSLDHYVLEWFAPKEDVINNKCISYQQQGRVYEDVHGKFRSENCFVLQENSTNVKYPQSRRHPSSFCHSKIMEFVSKTNTYEAVGGFVAKLISKTEHSFYLVGTRR